jgi:hypothetical protein
MSNIGILSEPFPAGFMRDYTLLWIMAPAITISIGLILDEKTKRGRLTA